MTTTAVGLVAGHDPDTCVDEAAAITALDLHGATIGLSIIDPAGNVVPGPASASAVTDCLVGTTTIEAAVFGADGTSLLGAPFASSVWFDLPA